jgi:endo-1,4-beta-xylanase
MDALETDAAYRDALARDCNICVAENAFKQEAVWVGPYEYDFDQTDALCTFAQDNGMVLRGHTLVWHQQIPKWLKSGSFTPADIRKMLHAYINSFVGRYAGKMGMWDVVNEAISDDAPNALREKSFYFQTLGPDFIRDAFHWAHDADPKARLYYNDYNIEGNTPKASAALKLVGGLKSDGVPIHGVGMQGHLTNGWRVTDADRENVRRLAGIGLTWQITEADISVPLSEGVASREDLETQALAFADLVDLCLEEHGCEGLVFWGLTDKYSWIPGFRPGWGAALPLDEEMRAKPGYIAMAKRLISTQSEQPHAQSFA